jgi:hypothetical protein
MGADDDYSQPAQAAGSIHSLVFIICGRLSLPLETGARRPLSNRLYIPEESPEKEKKATGGLSGGGGTMCEPHRPLQGAASGRSLVIWRQ